MCLLSSFLPTSFIPSYLPSVLRYCYSLLFDYLFICLNFLLFIFLFSYFRFCVSLLFLSQCMCSLLCTFLHPMPFSISKGFAKDYYDSLSPPCVRVLLQLYEIRLAPWPFNLGPFYCLRKSLHLINLAPCSLRLI